MGLMRKVQVSFSGGEVTPEFYGKIDDAKYQSGAASLRNFIPLPHGPVANRAGFAFVSEVKDSTQATRIIPFTYSTTQTMVIQLGAGYIRFHTVGANLLYSTPAAYNAGTNYAVGDMASNGGTNYYCISPTVGNAPPNATYWYALPASMIYEIPSPYAAADLFAIKYVQSNDVLTLVHPNYAPRELRRVGATNWQLTTISFASTLAVPTGVTATPAPASGTTSYSYVVVAVGPQTINKSLASANATCVNNLLVTGNLNTIAWTAVTGASRYYVYKQSNGLYGYIGQTDGLSFVDNNIAPDISNTPPQANNPFTGAGNYPGAVSYFEQRRCFAGTINNPQKIWMTRSGTESDLSYSIPTRADDEIEVKVAAREANTIRHLAPMSNLIMLTSGAEWRMSSNSADALTPANINIRPQSYVGANDATPVMVNNNLIYAAARGGHVRELTYSWQSNGFITGDLSLRAIHLFDNQNILDMAYGKAPYPIVWFVSDTGNLLSLTYIPEQQIGAWAHHDTDGVFESVAVVAEGNEDRLYAVVRRTINGVSKRYVEEMASRQFTAQANAFFVDCGATFNGAPTTTVSGLTWLEGKTVSILGDGAVFPSQVVTGGTVTLNNPASKITVGLPITADIQTLPLAVQVDASFDQGRLKNVNQAWLRVNRSSGIFAGPDFNTLTEAKIRTTEAMGTPPSLISDEVQLYVMPAWDNAGGSVCVRQTYPLPLEVLSMTLEVSVGG